MLIFRTQNVTSSSIANAVLEAARYLIPRLLRCCTYPCNSETSNLPSSFKSPREVLHISPARDLPITNSKHLSSVPSVLPTMYVSWQRPTECKLFCRHLIVLLRSWFCLFNRPVVMHSDHCAEKLLPWFDGMLDADEQYFKEHGEPLFSSHMLDLSEEPKDKNIAICAKYFQRMAPLGLWLEMEIGITGGEEDGVDNTGVDKESLYTQPQDVFDVYKTLSAIGPNFSVAAAFGNVHGVYKPGNVRLRPELLAKHQEYASGQIGGRNTKPL